MTSARSTPAALLLLSLAACSQGTEAPAGSPAPPASAPVILGEIDLNQPIRALGTEPFWGVEISSDTLVYSGVDRPERRVRHSGPTVQGTTAVYTGATPEGAAMVLTLVATECSDGMSDRVYPLIARVELGDETQNGCAASVAALAEMPPA